MGYNNNVLIRDDLGDDGSFPSHGSYCSSPDIICHEQVADPQASFATSDAYAADQNEAVRGGSASNCIYVRARNLSGARQTAYLRLYRANASLFMRPSLWRDNRMSTLEGSARQRVDLAGSSIVAAGSPFMLNAQASYNYYLVGIANDSTDETVPEDFSSYNDFCVWVRQTPAVGVRNLWCVGTPATSFETNYAFSNPEARERLVAFTVKWSGVPTGTEISFTCAPLGISVSWVTTGRDEEKPAAGMVPAGFDGFATAAAVLPSGESRWPDDARIDISAYIAMEPQEEAYRFGVPFNAVPGAAQALARFDAIGRLVSVGECAIVFRRG